MKNLLLVTAAVALAGCLSTAANASYSVQVSTGLTSGNGFTTNNVNPFASLSNTATATFTYTGDISFDNEQAQNSSPSGDLNSTFFGSNASNISGYHGSGQVQLNSSTTIADFSGTDPANFLNSSGSESDYRYGSWYSFDLGVLAAGTTLTITHDDGVSLYQGTTNLGGTIDGPTTKTTDVVTLATGGDTFLYYSRQNGSPSVLEVALAGVDPRSSAVPEPTSLAILGAGLFGIGALRRRCRA